MIPTKDKESKIRLKDFSEMMPSLTDLKRFETYKAKMPEDLKGNLHTDHIKKAYFLNRFGMEFNYCFLTKLKTLVKPLDLMVKGRLNQNLQEMA